MRATLESLVKNKTIPAWIAFGMRVYELWPHPDYYCLSKNPDAVFVRCTRIPLHDGPCMAHGLNGDILSGPWE